MKVLASIYPAQPLNTLLVCSHSGKKERKLFSLTLPPGHGIARILGGPREVSPIFVQEGTPTCTWIVGPVGAGPKT